MNELELQEIASQLRKPHGVGGISTAEWMNKGNRQMYADTLFFLNPAPSDNILEIGMGNGLFVGDILSHADTISYTGCDFSELMVAEARKINAHWLAKGQTTFLCADVSVLPLADSLFNKIFTVNTIYFWANQDNVLKEISRVLQPDGLLVIALRPKHYTEKYPFIKYGFNQFSKEDVYELLRRNGFDVTGVYEHPEPDMEMNGEIMKMENLILTARKR